MRIVVTGYGRSGSQYLAAVLTACGFRCTHERIYNHDIDPQHPDLPTLKHRWSNTDIEVSWLAAPFLHTINHADTIVWHQLRDPVKSLTCWAQHRLLSIDDNAARFVHKVLPDCANGSDMERAITYLIQWTELIENSLKYIPHMEYQVEQLTPGLLTWMLKYSGHNVNEEVIATAMQQTSKDKGTCGYGTHVEIPWEKVTQIKGGKELSEMAQRYGYRGK